jgi:small conductance mechanosensitive channel
MHLDPYYLVYYGNTFLNVFIDYSPKLISAFLILFVGLYATRIINRLIRKVMVKREFGPTLIRFLSDILLWVFRIVLFITFLPKLGIETSSFVAILAATELAIGLPLQSAHYLFRW